VAVVTQPKPTGACEPPFAPEASQASIELYWLPLGAGGWFVRLNGRIYEAIHALLERRQPLDLYHSALQVRVPEGRFVIENCWPIPDADGPSRGVVVEGPVASRRMAHWRVFRYEVRRWRDGVIADADEAVASPQSLTDDPLLARRLLDLVGCLPSPVWGRDELGTGEMWNSNSVVSWLLARSGLPTNAISPPAGGRAPGWQAGLVTAAVSSQATSGPGTAPPPPPRAWGGGNGLGDVGDRPQARPRGGDRGRSRHRAVCGGGLRLLQRPHPRTRVEHQDEGRRDAHRCPHRPRRSLPDGVHLSGFGHQRVRALRAPERVGDGRPVKGHAVWLEGPGAAER
jgi:hypothetical protein